jgi:hypothetical protein
MSTPTTASNTCSLHQKQPSAKTAIACPFLGSKDNFLVCALELQLNIVNNVNA